MRVPINMAGQLMHDLVSLKIVKCFRVVFDNTFQLKSNEHHFLKNDGNIYLQFSNDKVVAFYPYTESFTVYVEEISKEKIPDKAIDITSHSYFKKKSEEKIKSIKYLYFEHNRVPYGVQFLFSNGEKLSIEYCSENEYTFDALIIN